MKQVQNKIGPIYGLGPETQEFYRPSSNPYTRSSLNAKADIPLLFVLTDSLLREQIPISEREDEERGVGGFGGIGGCGGGGCRVEAVEAEERAKVEADAADIEKIRKGMRDPGAKAVALGE